MKKRCQWCTEDPLYIEYHDHEWGVPVHSDAKWFELFKDEKLQILIRRALESGYDVKIAAARDGNAPPYPFANRGQQIRLGIGQLGSQHLPIRL